ATNRWADWPLLAKLSTLGVLAHMGLLFGLANQLLLAALALGLICVMVWGYRMWWQRRPTRADRQQRPFGRPPTRGTCRPLPRPALILGVLATAAAGWAVPWFGLPLLAFLLTDLTVGRLYRHGARRRPATPPA